MTQVAHNSVTTNILLPVLAPLSCYTKINPIFLMLPMTLVTSFAFMLPVSTTPNTIVFEPSGMTTMDMIKFGFPLSLTCLGVTLIATNTYGFPLFDLDDFQNFVNCTNTI